MGNSNAIFCEGCWFCVPINQGRYVLGIISRIAVNHKILFGYFFPNILQNIPDVNSDVIRMFSCDDSFFSCLFGSMGFMRNEWHIIGLSERWDRDKWPMPSFKRTDPVTGTIWIDTLSEETLTTVVQTRQVSDRNGDVFLPDHSLYGYKALETILRKMLNL